VTPREGACVFCPGANRVFVCHDEDTEQECYNRASSASIYAQWYRGLECDELHPLQFPEDEVCWGHCCEDCTVDDGSCYSNQPYWLCKGRNANSCFTTTGSCTDCMGTTTTTTTTSSP
jgi:hypothetical protein